MAGSPSPVALHIEHLGHTYQTTSEGSDHSLLGHSHQCLCPNDTVEAPGPGGGGVGDHCHHRMVGHGHSLLSSHNHLNVINQLANHPRHSLLGAHSQAMHVRASIHASPKSLNSRLSHIPKLAPTNLATAITTTQSSCTCHLQTTNETPPLEIHEANIVQNRKLDSDDSIEVSPLPPALPPRPPPRQRTFEITDGHGSILEATHSRFGSSGSHESHGGGIRKYVFWCCACGGLATIIGALFLAVYFLLRSYTSTLGYFETIPTFVPATMLMLTGLCVMSLARRKNRFSYLIKVSGVCCLVCALTCVLVTITTTVIHMNRLQTLRECVYTQKTRTCTCYSVLLEAHAETDEGTRFVFDSTPDCEVIHGALYSCLRAMFGLSVSGILVCIFSCMLVYQLLSHERKKMYWEQLELRCRSLYQHQSNAASTAAGSMRPPPLSLTSNSAFCSCCEECRYTPVPVNPHIFPWDAHALDRFWSPGRIGNFYSPNPGEELATSSSLATNVLMNGREEGGRIRDSRASSGGWSWRRLPWSRAGCPDSTRVENNLNYPPPISSPDSQYGFSSTTGLSGATVVPHAIPGRLVETITATAGSGGYTVLADRPPVGAYLWGPPPPYSNPDSPARRGLSSPVRYQHPHHHVHHQHSHSTHCQLSEDNHEQQNTMTTECQHRARNRPVLKDSAEPEVINESQENTDHTNSERISNTLPARKTKKRMDISSVKSVASNQNFRTNIQNVFTSQTGSTNLGENSDKYSTESTVKPDNTPNSSPEPKPPKCRFLPRLQGVENPAFQTQENPQKQEPTESEVYFADVSSCCNISVRNDGQDSSLYDEALETIQKARLMVLQEPEGSTVKQENTSSASVTEDEDYLSHRIGKRQMSTRSRLPFPLPPSSDDLNMEMGSEVCLQLLPKDVSQSSLCSSVQTPLTETTDDAVTPVSSSGSSDCCLKFYADANNSTIRHIAFSTDSGHNQFLAPDAQYEVIQQTAAAVGGANYPRHSGNSNLATTIAGGLNTNKFNFSPNSPKNLPPKTLGVSPRNKNIGSNISTLIQNLGGNPVGLLYGEVNSGGEDEEMQTQATHSDATMDSGWQSGSDRPELKRAGDHSDEQPKRSVNV